MEQEIEMLESSTWIDARTNGDAGYVRHGTERFTEELASYANHLDEIERSLIEEQERLKAFLGDISDKNQNSSDRVNLTFNSSNYSKDRIFSSLSENYFEEDLERSELREEFRKNFGDYWLQGLEGGAGGFSKLDMYTFAKRVLNDLVKPLEPEHKNAKNSADNIREIRKELKGALKPVHTPRTTIEPVDFETSELPDYSDEMRDSFEQTEDLIQRYYDVINQGELAYGDVADVEGYPVMNTLLDAASVVYTEHLRSAELVNQLNGDA